MEDTPPPAAAEAQATKPVDLADDSLKVNIADALNEQDIVKFTVHTKTTLDRFSKRDFQVTRQHEEFVWLHERFVENQDYAGLIIPPCPPKPDFSQSHGKLAKLQAGDASMPTEELEKLKQEIQSEYLAAFQKTVAMHEVFLIRLATHPSFRDDSNLQVFLEYDKDLACKSKSRKDRAFSFLQSIGKAVDSSFNNHKDTDEFFDQQKFFIVHYNAVIKEAATKAEQKVKKRQGMVSHMDRSATQIVHLANAQTQYRALSDVLRKTGETLSKAQTVEKKLAAKEDLKLTDLLRYYVSDGQAAKDLMWRRIKAYQAQEEAKKKLDQAKLKGKKVVEAQETQTQTQERFEQISRTAKEELKVFKQRRLQAFRKGIIQYTQCQIRQAKEEQQLWKDLLTSLNSA